MYPKNSTNQNIMNVFSTYEPWHPILLSTERDTSYLIRFVINKWRWRWDGSFLPTTDPWTTPQGISVMNSWEPCSWENIRAGVEEGPEHSWSGCSRLIFSYFLPATFFWCLQSKIDFILLPDTSRGVNWLQFEISNDTACVMFR